MAEHQATAPREEQTSRHRPTKWQSKRRAEGVAVERGLRALGCGLIAVVAAFVEAHRMLPQKSEFYCGPAYASTNLI